MYRSMGKYGSVGRSIGDCYGVDLIKPFFTYVFPRICKR